MPLTCAACVFCASAADTLPEWAVGTYSGKFVNWCEEYDDPDDIGPWYSSSAKMTVKQDGKITGEVRFGELTGTPQGACVVASSTEDSIVLSLKWRWYEKGDVDELELIEFILRRTSSGVEMEFVEKEMLENRDEDPYEDCPVAGTFTKTASAITIPDSWQKARTLKGIATRATAHPIQGVFELKCGKANKQGIAKVSATLTGLDGKKTSYKAKNVDVTGNAATVNFNGMAVTIDGESFEGGEDLSGGLSVQSATVGGNWTGRGATVTVDANDLSMFAGRVLADFLPNDEQANVNNGKWTFNKAASVKWAKPKKGTAQPDIYDEDSQKGLIVDTSKGKTNLSGLKLTYTPKKGTYKGKFTVYALEGSGKATKLKKYTFNVTGVVVDGVGYGAATSKKPAGVWAVTVR